MNKLKIGYFADGPWAHRAFEKIKEDPRFKIQFICVRNDSGDKVLEQYATGNSIPLLKHPKVSSSEFLDSIEKFNCDIFVSMSFNQILKKNFIDFPPLKTINCHAGKLPFYRGRNILNWVLINDEKEFGITVHYVDEGIDTGDIILQRTYPISDEDTYDTLLKLSYSECANALYDALGKIYNNDVQVIKQHTIHPVGFYCTQRKEGDEIINWDSTSRDIFNFVRAISNPGPMAQTSLREKTMKINRVSMIKDAPNYKMHAGVVVGKNGKQLLVKTTDKVILVDEFEYDGAIHIGDRLK